MRYLSLFSGIEAASNAWHDFGTPVAFSEIEPFPCAVLAHHYPQVPNLGDVTKITEEQIKSLGPIDIVVFGSPCQDLSVAGKRKGFKDADGNDTRSGLFTTAIRLIQWARRHNGCRFALWENVPGAFSSNKGADFASVVSLMAGLGGIDTPKNGWGTEGAAVGDAGMLEWAVLDAQWFNVAQRRKRVFALVDFGDWPDRAPILLERDSLRGDSAPSRETGERVAPTVGTGASFSRTGNDRVEAEALVVSTARMVAFGEYSLDGTASTCKARDYKDATDLVYSMATKQQSLNIGINLANSIGANDYKEPQAVIYALAGNTIGRKPKNGGNGTGYDDTGVAYTLTKTDVHGVVQAPNVRRLTPVECARLQGFSDEYLDIDFKGKPATDGHKYKALGNSMAVPVMRWIGMRIKSALEITA